MASDLDLTPVGNNNLPRFSPTDSLRNASAAAYRACLTRLSAALCQEILRNLASTPGLAVMRSDCGHNGKIAAGGESPHKPRSRVPVFLEGRR
jgi:hypothetical protein